MADDFIPLNQSTPNQNQKRWHSQGFQQSGQSGGWAQNQRRGYNQRMNNSQRNSSYGSDNNSSHGKDKSIDAYLHPSMLQDPWAYLRRRNAENQSF